MMGIVDVKIKVIIAITMLLLLFPNYLDISMYF
jgi:hypothetical protein